MTDSRTDAESTARQQQTTSSAEVEAVLFGAEDNAEEAKARAERIVVETTGPDAAEPEQAADPGSAEESDSGAREQTLLEQMGGIVGLVSSTIPVLVFILVNALTSLQPAIWSAIGAAVLVAVWRLLRKEPLQPAVSGVLGVAICAFIAYRTGSAKGFFLFGIWTSLLYGGVFLLSAVVRWPLAGVVWSVLNGTGFSWRGNRKVLVGYDIATLAWTLVFAARFVVQRWLYDTDQTGWLAVARIGMGYPPMALALLVTVWAIRRERKLTAPESAGDATAAGPG